MPDVTLTCEQCGKLFTRNKSEHARNQRHGRRVFCGRSCVISHNNRYNRPPETREAPVKGRPRIKSRFEYFLRVIRRRKRDCTLTRVELRHQWEKQDGVCPLTGWKMALPKNVSGFENAWDPQNASVDRIDSSKGYHADNIRFICLGANIARSTWSDEQLVKLATAVVQQAERLAP